MSTREIAQACGITYRQLDHWVRCGWLHPARAGGGPVTGSGHRRQWPVEEVRVAAGMAALVKAGLTVQAAHRVARAGRAEAVIAALGEPAPSLLRAVR